MSATNTAAQNMLPHVAQASTRETALAKINAVHLAQYERTRNALNGAVSRLSPYLTHGITDVPEVITLLGKRTRLGWRDKFSFELGWREYFYHVWRVIGDDIWRAQRPPPAADTVAYSGVMPEDIVTASTGVAIIDDQVRLLYRTGYLHNHARMWLASYMVHVRKVDWRVGARWMYAYLLDGDLASNTLSWQWVAGTWTGKPYLFNAENVAKYAPGFNHSGTAIDCTYDTLEQIARQRPAMPEAPQKRAQSSAVPPPALVAPQQFAGLAHEHGLEVIDSPPTDFSGTLLHPWSLNWPAHVPTCGPADRPTPSSAIGLIVPAFHNEFPWSAQRWNFVLRAMHECCDKVWIVGEASKSALASICVARTLNPHYSAFIDACVAIGATSTQAPRAFIDPDQLHRSFSSFWHRANKEKFPL